MLKAKQLYSQVLEMYCPQGNFATDLQTLLGVLQFICIEVRLLSFLGRYHPCFKIVHGQWYFRMVSGIYTIII